MSLDQQIIEKPKTQEETLSELKEKAAELFSKKEDFSSKIDSLLKDNPSATSSNDIILESYLKELDSSKKELGSTLDQIAVMEAEDIIENKQKSDLESKVEKKPMTELQADILYHQKLVDNLKIKSEDIKDLKQKIVDEQKEIESLSKLEATEENKGRIAQSESLIKQYNKMIDSAEGPIKALETLKNAEKLNGAKEKEAKL